MNREKEIKEKVAAECYQKGWRSDYNTACSDKHDFVRCPDDFECLESYTKDFVALCHELTDEDNSCEQCWNMFLKGDLNEKN